MKLLLKILVATAFFATILLAGTLGSCDGETETSPTHDLYLSAYRELDADGAVTLERIYDADGKLLTESDISATVAYIYNADGSIAREERYADRDMTEPPTRTLYTYGETDGVVWEERRRGDTLIYRRSQRVERLVEIFTEADAGEMIVTDFYEEGAGSWSTKAYYDENRVLTHINHCDETGWTWVSENFSYDREGRLLQRWCEFVDTVAPQTIADTYAEAAKLGAEFFTMNDFDNVYDADGSLTERIFYDLDGYPYKTTVYTYDEHGNCVREETRSPDGSLISAVEREFAERAEPTPTAAPTPTPTAAPTPTPTAEPTAEPSAEPTAEPTPTPTPEPTPEPTPTPTPEPTPEPEPEFIMTYYVESIIDVVRDERTYDEAGRILTRYQHGNGDTLYFYDEQGRLSRKEQYDIRGDGEEPTLWWYTTYTYHADGTYTEQSTYYDYFDHDVVNAQYTYLCNADGNTLEAEWWDTYYEGVLSFTAAYEYDDRGREISYKEYNEDGSLRKERTRVYTETADSFITEGFRYGERTFRDAYYYDEDGREIRREYAAYGDYAYSWSIDSTYDESGNLIETKHYEDGRLSRTEVHTYDEAGRILSTRIERGSSGGGMQASVTAEYFHSGYDYVYDEQGRLVEKTAHNWRDASEGTVTTYTYDEHGNCIREDSVMMNGRTYGYIERKFVRNPDYSSD